MFFVSEGVIKKRTEHYDPTVLSHLNDSPGWPLWYTEIKPSSRSICELSYSKLANLDGVITLSFNFIHFGEKNTEIFAISI